MVAGAELISAKSIIWPFNLSFLEALPGLWGRLKDGIWQGAPFSFSFLLFLTDARQHRKLRGRHPDQRGAVEPQKVF